MQRPLLGAFATLLLMGSVLVLFLAGGDERPEPPSGGEARGTGGTDSRDDSALTAAGSPAPPGLPAGRRSVPDVNVHLTGVVVFPDGTPADEELFVEAHAPARDATGAPVSKDGTFVLPLPADAAQGKLLLRGRYLRLPAPVPYHIDSGEPVRLRPQLGGRLEVTVRPPADGDGSPFGITIDLSDPGSSGAAPLRRVPDGAGRTSFDALGTDALWRLRVGSPNLYDAHRGPLQLQPGHTLHLEVPLIRGARLTGRVRFGDGSPAAGALVAVHGVSDTGRRAIESVKQTCDAEGRFAFAGLRPGPQALVATVDGEIRGRLDVERIPDGEERRDLELVLDAGTEVTGLVLWPDGDPAVGARVTITAQHGFAERPVECSAGEDGAFRALVLAAPPYRVRAGADRPESGAGHSSLEDVDGGAALRLVLRAGNRLGGRVIDDAGEVVERFEVSARQLGTGNTHPLEVLRERIRNEQGAFALEDVPAGNWSVSVGAVDHIDSSPWRVRLPDGAGTQREFVLARKASLRGRILEPGGAPSPAGTALARWPGSGKTARTDDEGRFHLRGLEPGPITLRGRGEESAWGPETVLVLRPGEERELDLSAGRPGRIRGHLHDSVADRKGRLVHVTTLDYTFDDSAVTDSDGRFAFEGLAAGDYRVYLNFLSRGGLDREWAEGYAARAEELVSLAAGEDRSVVLGAPRPGLTRVNGRLTQSGEPLAHQIVYAYPGAEDNFPITVGYAEEDGTFLLRLPAPGAYTISSAPGAEHAFTRELRLAGQGDGRLDIELATGSIPGILLGPDGAPRPHHTLLLRRASASLASRRAGDMRTTRTGDDGRFLFQGVEDGRWELRSGGFHDDHRKRSEGIAIRSDLVVRAGRGPEDVELRLRAGAVLTGRCLGPDGAPVPGARIHVTYADGSRMLPWTGETSDWNGAFHIPAIHPGPVQVHAEHDGRSTRGVRVTLVENSGGGVELIFE